MIGNEKNITVSRRAWILLVFLALSMIFAGPAHAALACSACHTMPPTDSAAGDRQPATGAFKGNHAGHSGATANSCTPCHGVEAASYTSAHSTAVRSSKNGLIIKLTSKIHNYSTANGRAHYSRGTFFNQTSVPPNPLGTCSNINCHFETTTPAWGTANFASPADCNKCHGAAPADGNHPKHTITYFGTPATTNACVKCHSDHTADSNPFAHATSAGNRGLVVSFAAAPNNGFGRYTGNVSYPNYLPSQSLARNGTCQSTYCHSPGTKGTAPFIAPNQTATWGGTLGCGGCHEASPLTGSHNPHVASTYGVPVACYKCHSATVTSGMTISSTTNHVNKKVDIAFSSTTTAVLGKYSGHLTPMQKNAGSGYANCENVYCHSSGQGAGGTWPPTYSTPKWGDSATGKCGTCHDAGIHTAVLIKSGSHTKHLLYEFDGARAANMCGSCHWGAGFAAASCSQCHLGGSKLTTLHVNHQVDVSFTTKFGGTYNGTPEPGNGYSTCSTVYCHSNGLASSPTYYTPTWGTSSDGACGTCHGVTATAPPASSAHVKHMGAGNPYLFKCAACHSGKVQVTANSTVAPTFTNLTSHVNKLRDVKFDAMNPNGTYTAATQTCSSAYCHSIGKTGGTVPGTPASSAYGAYSASFPYSKMKWSGTTNCRSCHGRTSLVPGAPDYASAAAGAQYANSHPKHVQSSTNCQYCHQKTTVNGTSILATSTDHVDGNIDVRFKRVSVFTTFSGSFTSGGKSCSATYCHGSGMPVWGNNGAYKCNDCHSALSSDTDWATTNPNAHLIHLNAVMPARFQSMSGNVSTTAAYRYSCSACHDPNRAMHAVGPQTANRAAEVFFSFTTVSHGSITYAEGGTVKVDKLSYNWTNGGAGTTANSCSATYCHSNGQVAGFANGADVNWGTSVSSATPDARCKKCHNYTAASGSPIATGSHGKHVNGTTYSFSCRKCHVVTTADGTTIADKTKHVNKLVNVAFNNTTTAVGGTYNNLASPMSKNPGPPYASCGNTYCHSKGTSITPSSPNNVPTWNVSLPTDCSGCHGGDNNAANKMGNGGGSAAHAKHVQTYTYGCVKCHAATVSANRTISNYTTHVNRQVNVAFNNTTTAVNGTYNGSASPMFKLPGSATGTCGNVYCHSIGNTIVAPGRLPGSYGIYAAPNWSGGALGCNSCHGRSTPNSGVTYGMPDYANGKMGSMSANSHPKHVSTSNIACVECHEKTTKNNTTIRSPYPGKHVNNVAHDVYFNLSGLSAAGIYNNSPKTCSSTYCHGTGPSIAWGGTTYCNSCHSANLSGVSGSNYWANNSQHKAHIQDSTILPSKYANYSGNVSTSGSYRFACYACHKGQHVMGPTAQANSYGAAAEVFFGYTSPGRVGTYSFAAQVGAEDILKWSAGTCSTTYCHSDGNGGGPKVSSFNWNSPKNTLRCFGCHGSQDWKLSSAQPAYSSIRTQAHARHIRGDINTELNKGNGLDCSRCHAKTVSAALNSYSTVGAGVLNKKNHVNKMRDYSGASNNPNGGSASSGTFNPTTHACNNVYCHSNSKVGIAGYELYANPDAWNSGAANKKCNYCHGRQTAGTNLDSDAAFSRYTSTGVPNYLSGAAGSATANSHRQHMAKMATTTYSDTQVCYSCHSATLDSTTGVSASAAKFRPYSSRHTSGAYNIKFKASISGTYTGGAPNKYCSSTLCHGGTSPQWGANTTNDTCTKCHGTGTASVSDANRYVVAPPINTARVAGTLTGNGQVSNDPKVGAHQTHVRFLNGFSNYSTQTFRCENCHGTLPTVGTHANGSSDPTSKFQGMATNRGARTGATSVTFNTTNLTCSNTYCHNPSGAGGTLKSGNLGANVFPSWTGAKYLADGNKTTAPANCSKCHKVPGDSGFTSDFEHAGQGITIASNCTVCHGHNGDTGGTVSRHLDGIKSTEGHCDACHGYLAASWSLSWPATYEIDFVTHEGKGAHAKHVAYLLARFSVSLDPAKDNFGSDTTGSNGSWTKVCGVCHNGATHMAGTTRQISFNSVVLQFGPNPPTYTGVPGASSATNAKSCSNVSCHYLITPVWSSY